MAGNYELIEGFQTDAANKPGADAIRAYERDGVVCLRSAFSDEWVEKGRRAVAAAIRSQNRSIEHSSYQKSGEQGRFFYDTFLWKRLPSWRDFTFNSPAAELAKNIMRSQGLLLYFDMAIVKEPGSSAITPWHYDEAYWRVSGTQVCNVWMALDTVAEDTALRFAAGSHKLKQNFSSIDFFTKKPYEGQQREIPTQWDQIDTDRKILVAAVEPGDCVILNLRTHHSAPGNFRKTRRRAICTHWFGDDARYDDKPWPCDPDERGEGLTHGGPLECATFPRVFA